MLKYLFHLIRRNPGSLIRLPFIFLTVKLTELLSRAAWEKAYPELKIDKSHRASTLYGLPNESEVLLGEIVYLLRTLEPIDKMLLVGETDQVKETYHAHFKIAELTTTGLGDRVDRRWDFNSGRPDDLGKHNVIISQAILEHLLAPFCHVRELAESLTDDGTLIIHTVLPGFPYHRYPIDGLRFFPDWFEETSKRLDLVVRDRFIRDGHLIYAFQKGNAA